ncbi:MAG: wax ester/triacylglycerol synthase family O-acyltransferase [Acidimicrobiales bacterium]|nr:wax ester/triacylglycerol synthase family O-acyltransferase [Acidimicrobiales bacterium]
MERLSGLDAGFLYMETPTLLMHTLKLAVLETAPGQSDLPLAWFRQQIADRLHLLPPFRRRVVEVPLGLNHPVWVEDPDFDIDYHVRRVKLPVVGDRGQLDEVVADIAGRPLDRRRPLWELYLIDGFEGSKLAVLVKIHHAVVDGMAAAALLANVMSTTPEELGESVPAGPPRWYPEELPTRRRLVVEALRDQARLIGKLPALVWRTLHNLADVVRHRRTMSVTPPRPVLDTPRTSFNRALTPRRSFATATFSLEEVRKIRRAFGVTVNDVVLAVVGGALRRYLIDRGELPDRSLVAGVPVSTDRPDEIRRLGGNRVSNLFTTLATDEPDPVRRLQIIHEVTAEARVLHNLLGVEMMHDWVQYTPPKPYSFAVRLWSRLRIADQFPPPINVVVSNVPGPREPLFVGGARLLSIYSVGPVLEGIGLNITVWSYLDQLNVGVLACRDAVADSHAITRAIGEAIAELAERSQIKPAIVG